MKNWNVPVTWEMCGIVSVPAETLSQAMEIARDEDGDIPLPAECSYVDGSWSLSSDDEGVVAAYQNIGGIEMNGHQKFEDYLASRGDLIDNLSYQLAVTFCKTDSNLADEDALPWNMEIIGAINDAVEGILKEHSLVSCWPYNEDETPCYLTDSCTKKDCPFKGGDR